MTPQQQAKWDALKAKLKQAKAVKDKVPKDLQKLTKAQLIELIETLKGN